jgi:hypothetical protein
MNTLFRTGLTICLLLIFKPGVGQKLEIGYGKIDSTTTMGIKVLCTNERTGAPIDSVIVDVMRNDSIVGRSITNAEGYCNYIVVKEGEYYITAGRRITSRKIIGYDSGEYIGFDRVHKIKDIWNYNITIKLGLMTWESKSK